MTRLVERSYPDIVRDVLTTLTQGVAGEVHRVAPYDRDARPVVVPDVVLRRRPVRRVSLVAGSIEVPGEGGRTDLAPYVFTPNDYELVGRADDPEDLSTIRFLPFGRNPAPDTDLHVNYYPRHAPPAPLTDVNVGSVTRTLTEALARELALVYEQINLAYESAFLETATGVSLDRVVALLGIRRFRAGRPVGTVRFSRRPGSVGTISIPAGTPVTDAADTIRYETVETHTMLPGESTAEVRVRGVEEATATVEPGVLRVIQRSVAGIDVVTNEAATARATQDESDGELRARARGALGASNKGTVGALVSGLLQHPDVRAVNVQEFVNGIAGELRLSLSLANGGPPGVIPDSVRARIEALRPAGIRVLPETAETVQLQVRVGLVLAGSFLPPGELETLHASVRRTLAGLVAKVAVGQRVRVGPLVSAILADERVVDARVALGPAGGQPGAPGADFEPAPTAIAELAETDVSFEPDAFAEPLVVGAEEIPVDVQAVVPATPTTGTPLGQVESQIRVRLAAYVAALAPATQVDAAAVLQALRDDAKYQLDALRLRVTFAFEDQFAEVAQGGPSFTVRPGHVFTVSFVEVAAPGGDAA